MSYNFTSREDLEKFIQTEILTSSEALEYLGISRQALNSLVKRGKLAPIKEEKTTKLFFKEDLMKRERKAYDQGEYTAPVDTRQTSEMNQNEYLEACSLIVCLLEGYVKGQDWRKKRPYDDKDLALKVRELLKTVQPYFYSLDDE